MTQEPKRRGRPRKQAQVQTPKPQPQPTGEVEAAVIVKDTTGPDNPATIVAPEPLVVEEEAGSSKDADAPAEPPASPPAPPRRSRAPRRVLMQDAPLRFKGSITNNVIVVEEEVIREHTPPNSRRPVRYLVYAAGTVLANNEANRACME